MTIRQTPSARPRLITAASVAGLALASSAPAFAIETISYGYDARGRLVAVERGGASTRYTYDKADNRLSRTVEGGAADVAVVRIGGSYRIVPLARP